jgi:hypothetical protein
VCTFALTGGKPRTKWLDPILGRDAGDSVLTWGGVAPRCELLAAEWPLETGTFVVVSVGDVRHGPI